MKLKIPCKENLFFSIASTGIALCIIVQCISLYKMNELLSFTSDNEPYECEAVNAKDQNEISDKAIYRLYECGGKIGIYDADTEVIIDIVDIFVSTLPPNDKAALNEGIDIYSFVELSKIINDFST